MIDMLSELEFSTHTNEERQYLMFDLREEMYGIGINRVKEIVEYGKVTLVPLMPDFVIGVLNLRGEVVPVIDISLRLGKAATKIHPRSCIVILDIEFNQETVLLGFVVDSVKEVIEIDAGQIEPPPTFGAKIDGQFIQGLIDVEEELVILLQGNHVLSIDELSALIENVIEN